MLFMSEEAVGKKSKGYYLDRLGEEKKTARTKGIRKQAKECAREARQRKKQYVELLEREVAELKRANTKIIQENENLKHLIKSQEKRGQKNTPEGFEGLMDEFKRMFVSLQNHDHSETSRSLSILRDKYGISGRERFKNIDGLLDRLVAILMPMHYRFLMENSWNNREFYSLLSPNSEQLIHLDEVKREVLLKVRPQMIRQKRQYDQILLSLAAIRDRIKRQNIECQGIVDEIEDKLSPAYVGRVLVDLDCCRSKVGLEQAYPLNFWQEAKTGLAPVSSHQHSEPEVNPEEYEYDEEILNSLFN